MTIAMFSSFPPVSTVSVLRAVDRAAAEQRGAALSVEALATARASLVRALLTFAPHEALAGGDADSALRDLLEGAASSASPPAFASGCARSSLRSGGSRFRHRSNR